MTLTVSDIDRWSAESVREVFHAARARAEASQKASYALSSLSVFETWGGTASQTAKAAFGDTSRDLEADANDAALVARAAAKADALALADAERAGATTIRAAIPRVGSTGIAAELTSWADGAEQLATSRRDGIEHPNPDVTAPPPAGYLQGSTKVQSATAELFKVCPSARPGPDA